MGMRNQLMWPTIPRGPVLLDESFADVAAKERSELKYLGLWEAFLQLDIDISSQNGKPHFYPFAVSSISSKSPGKEMNQLGLVRATHDLTAHVTESGSLGPIAVSLQCILSWFLEVLTQSCCASGQVSFVKLTPNIIFLVTNHRYGKMKI